jgi:serine/threonine protein kinase
MNMPPESIYAHIAHDLNPAPNDFRKRDLWSLGITLLLAVTGSSRRLLEIHNAYRYAVREPEDTKRFMKNFAEFYHQMRAMTRNQPLELQQAYSAVKLRLFTGDEIRPAWPIEQLVSNLLVIIPEYRPSAAALLNFYMQFPEDERLSLHGGRLMTSMLMEALSL